METGFNNSYLRDGMVAISDLGRTTAEINCTTGEVTIRDLTDLEIAEAEARSAKALEAKEAMEAAAEKAAADKASGNQKLKDLGLTDDEIAALTS